MEQNVKYINAKLGVQCMERVPLDAKQNGNFYSILRDQPNIGDQNDHKCLHDIVK